jgi:uncharacterized cupredoxin-like copper-binding protein
MSSVVKLRSLCVAALAVAAVALAACGSSSSSNTKSSSSSSSSGSKTTKNTAAAPASSGGAKVDLTAEESGGLTFNKKTATAKAGTVTLSMNNPSGNSLPHAIAVEGNGVDKDGKHVTAGGTSTVSVKLKPGKYTFYCPVDGHRKAGMQGTLTVN